MSQNPQTPKQQPHIAKEQIVPKPHNVIIINQPMVRTFSTGGGHGPEDTLVEGDRKLVTKKWQGHPPVNLNIIGKSHPPMPEVAIPRFLGTAQYATRVNFPNMLWVKLLVSPHPHARVRTLDVSKASKMPGVKYILTADNSPATYPLPRDLFFHGEIVGMVAAETEDLAEDAVAAIAVDYEVLPSAANIDQVMAANAPDLQNGRGPLRTLNQFGDVDKGFAEADIVKELTYRFNGAIPIPFQPGGSVAKWEGEHLTFYGMGQAIYPHRQALAKALDVPEKQVRFIDKYNGCTLGGGMALSKINPWIAYIARQTGRPVKLMMTKDHELSHVMVKPQNIQIFKIGVKKNGKITACQRTFHVNVGERDAVGQGGGRSELYIHVIPNWKEIGFMYRTNSIQTGPSRSNMQQEFKWGWEQMIDEMAEVVGMDPVEFRLLNVQKPGTVITQASGGPTIVPMPETLNGTLTYDSYASVEVMQEGAKNIGWEKRNKTPGGATGRFKRGMGMALNQHHAGRVGYHDGEPHFQLVAGGAIERARATGASVIGTSGFAGVAAPVGDAARGANVQSDGPSASQAGRSGGGQGADVYTGRVEVNGQGHVVLHFAQPDSGTNHATSMSALVGELLGYTTLSHIRVIWGDSDLTPSAPGWNSGLTTQLQGGALCRAAENLRADLLARAAKSLGVAADTLHVKDGVISTSGATPRQITFAAIATANGGTIGSEAQCSHPTSIGRSMNRGVGACFAEVEVDTWTGNYRFVRSTYCHDSGNIINPLVAEGDMNGSLMQSYQMATDSIPWDREFPGTKHFAVGFLSYRLPTIMEAPEQTNVFINSLEPRWYYGCKGFAETAIGAPPGALANAIYNACGVRIREHPITKEKIMAGLTAKAKGRTA